MSHHIGVSILFLLAALALTGFALAFASDVLRMRERSPGGFIDGVFDASVVLLLVVCTVGLWWFAIHVAMGGTVLTR